MSEPSRRLLLLRHSKAEHVFGKADHERELTDRGHAEVLGRHDDPDADRVEVAVEVFGDLIGEPFLLSLIHI